MRVITQPDTPESGTKLNDLSWRCFKAGLWTYCRSLLFILSIFSFSSLYSQTTISLTDEVIAKFGVEADLYANINELVPSDTDFEDTDDWFLSSTWPTSGLNVIAQSGTDSEGNDVGAVISSITSGNNFGEIRMSMPIYSMVDGYLWIDAVYFRDQRTNGNLVDATFFTSGNDKNFEDPINGWTIGTGNGGPQKNDIIEFFGHLRRDNANVSGNDNEYAIVGATTRSQSGTSHLDFEYFRKDMVLNAAGTGLEYDPERYGDLEGDELAAFLASLGCNRTFYQFKADYSVLKHGDVVFSVNYESGGDNINVELFVWIKREGLNVTEFNNTGTRPFTLSDKNGDFEFYPCPTDTRFGYAKIQPKDGSVLPVTAQVNQSSILGPPWGSFNSKGQPRGDLPALALVELSLDATELGLDTRSNQGECESPLGSVIVKTRSSAPFTAEQKDLAGPVNLGNTPPVSVELTDVDFCESESEDLVADIMPEDGDYLIEWYLLTGEDLATRTEKQSQTDINETNPGARSYTPTESGTYEVVVTVILGEDPENLGCFASARATATIYDDPEADLQTDGVCAGEDAIFTAAPTGNGEEYTFWIDDSEDGVIDDGEEILQAKSNDNTYDSDTILDGTTVSVLVETTDGCTDYATANAVIYENPEADLQTEGLCDGEDAIFTASPSGDGEEYIFWIDDSEDGVIDDGEEILQAKSNDNTYDSDTILDGTTVSVLVKTTDGCTDYATADAVIYENPEADLQTEGVCAGEDAIFTATPTGNGEEYTFWIDDSEDGVIDDGEEILQAKSNDNTYDSDTILDGTTVSVLVETTDGCTDYATANAVIYENPEADLQTEGVCDGEAAIFTASPSGDGEEYIFWIDDSEDGVIDDGEEILQAKSNDNTYDSDTILDGTMVSVLVETTDGCTDYATADAVIYENPEADLQTDGVCDGEDAIFTASPSGNGELYTFWEDTNADGVIDLGETVLQAESTDNTYDSNTIADGTTVTVLVETTDGCTGYASADAEIFENPVLTGGTVCVGETIDIGIGAGTYESSNNFVATVDNNGIVTGVSVGSVTITYTDGNGCSDTAIVDVELCVQEGCTLGYWKEHTDRWCDSYTTCMYYGDIFTSAPDEFKDADLTLLEALNLGGGGIYNLARQSVAALLNICSDEVSYIYAGGEAQLITDVNNAFDGIGEFNAGTKATQLDGFNQSDCPLGGTSATTAPSDSCPAEAAFSTATVESGFSVAPVPFGQTVNIKYEFDYTSDVRIQFFDLNGSLLRTYADKQVSNGDETQIIIDFALRSNQVYIVRVETDRGSFSKSILSGN